MNNILESFAEQWGGLGLGDIPLMKNAGIPPKLSEDIRTIQERALMMALQASDLKGSTDPEKLVCHAHQLISFTKRFLEVYHGKPDQADS